MKTKIFTLLMMLAMVGTAAPAHAISNDDWERICDAAAGGNGSLNRSSSDKEKNDKDEEKPDRKVVSQFAEYFKTHLQLPKTTQLGKIFGVSPSKLRKVYGGKAGLLKLAQEAFPKAFDVA